MGAAKVPTVKQIFRNAARSERPIDPVSNSISPCFGTTCEIDFSEKVPYQGWSGEPFVKVRTLATKAVNARHREIHRRAFFVSTQSFAGFYRSVPLQLPNPTRSRFERRFPSLERNPQGCARTCEQSVPNSLTLSFQEPPELTQSSRSESERKRLRTARLGVVLRPDLPQAPTGSEKRCLDLVSATAFHTILRLAAL
jgi:hypothetical protein